MSWQEVLRQPAPGDHIVHVYQDEAFLVETVCAYMATGLARGEAGIVIATEAHRAAFERALRSAGAEVDAAIAQGRLRLLDAEATLAAFMRGCNPDAAAFQAQLGGALAQLRQRFGSVRAYGEMVDVLWQQGEKEAAVRLEELWNQLAKEQDFSLLCAYFMDSLDAGSYEGLQCVCHSHTHLIPARDYARLDRAVVEASEEVMAEPFARMMLTLAGRGGAATEMPAGQKTLLWLQRNMPITAEKVLAGVKARC